MSTLKPIVINGHGSKTNQTFNIKDHTLLTPGSLNTPYVFSIDPNYSIEKDFQQYKIKDVKNGHWTFYDHSVSPQVKDVKISPWNNNELKSFAHNILKDPSFWANIDNQNGYYLSKDPNASLVIKKGNGYVHLNSHETEKFLTKVEIGEYSKSIDGTPLFFYADKIGKVKILSNTSLSEVLDQIDAISGPKLVMLATCNATDSKNISISYDTKSPAQDVVGLAHDHGVDLRHETHLEHANDIFENQHFTYGPLNKSLFTQGVELLTKCVMKNPNDISFYSVKDIIGNKTHYHAKIGELDINVSELLKKADFSHIQLDNMTSLASGEYAAIKDYSGSAYYNINNFLYENAIYLDIGQMFVKSTQIASGLNKMMPETFIHSKTYRGDDPSMADVQQRIDLIKNGGGTTDFEAFWSTSLSLNTAKAFSGSTIIHFEDKYGKSISHISYFPGENEYLLEPSTILWKKYEYVDGKHVFYAQKVVPLVEGKDTPSDNDISTFKKLVNWATDHGVNTDFITPHARDAYLDDIKPKSVATPIQLNDCLSTGNHTIQGLDELNTVSTRESQHTVEVAINTAPAMLSPPPMLDLDISLTEMNHVLLG